MERRTYVFTVPPQTFNKFKLQTAEVGVVLSISALISYLENFHAIFLSVPGECCGNDFKYVTFQILTYSLFIVVHHHLIR
jgi:hypothetical protein